VVVCVRVCVCVCVCARACVCGGVGFSPLNGYKSRVKKGTDRTGRLDVNVKRFDKANSPDADCL
jgi:hypothetical protein